MLASLFSLPLFLFLLFTPLPSTGAQPLPPPLTSPSSSSSSSSSKFSIAGIISPLATILITFMLVFLSLSAFSVYVIRHATSAGTDGGGGEGSCRRGGLDPATLETFPTLVYAAVKGLRIGEASLVCAVCLADFEDDDKLRLMPVCDHAFHPDCIGMWLASHTTCPVCRADLSLPPPPPTCAADSAPSLHGEPRAEEGSRHSEGDDEREQVELPAEPEVIVNKIENLNRVHPRDGSSVLIRFPRSHSTGHSLVRPGDDAERFTLRLPAELRKQLMDRATPIPSPREGSSRGGYRSTGEGSSRGGKYLRRRERFGLSDRWVLSRLPSFLTRMSSMLSPRSVAAANAGGGSSRGSNRPRLPV